MPRLFLALRGGRDFKVSDLTGEQKAGQAGLAPSLPGTGLLWRHLTLQNTKSNKKTVPNALFYTVPSTRVRREGKRRFLDAVPTKILPNSDNNNKVTPKGEFSVFPPIRNRGKREHGLDTSRHVSGKSAAI